MKYIYLTFFISVFSMANEISRMESIVEDIEKLRFNYTECIEELALKDNKDNSTELELKKTRKLMEEYQILLEKEKLKNTHLIIQKDELLKLSNARVEKLRLSEKPKKVIENILETKLKNEETMNKSLSANLKVKYEKIIKDKENIILSLKNRITVSKKSIIVKKETCEDDNPFPSLMMKQKKEKQSFIDIMDLKAQTYRLNKESEIYDEMDGNILFVWEKQSSFTAKKVTQSWLVITGYFPDGKWEKVTNSLWVKQVNASKR